MRYGSLDEPQSDKLDHGAGESVQGMLKRLQGRQPDVATPAPARDPAQGVKTAAAKPDIQNPQTHNMQPVVY